MDIRYFSGKTKKIVNTRKFSYEVFTRTYEKFRPKYFSRTKLKKALATEGISLAKHAETVFLVKMKKMKLFRNGIAEKVNNSVTLLEGDRGMKK